MATILCPAFHWAAFVTSPGVLFGYVQQRTETKLSPTDITT